MSKKQHAELSGSRAYIWIACAGAPALWKQIGDRPSGVAAREGTAAHALGQQILEYWKKTGEGENGLRQRFRAGTQFKFTDHDEKRTETVDQEMLDHTMVYVNDVLESVSRSGGPSDLMTEMHVDLENAVKKGMFGTADAVIVDKRKLFVFDFKYGIRTPVILVKDVSVLLSPNSEHELKRAGVNQQLLYYAVGALDKFNWRHEEVVLKIVQPRCHSVPDVQTLVLRTEYVKRWADEVLWQAAHAATQKDARRVVGDHCTWCDALGICPEAQKEVQQLALADFEEIDGPAAKQPVVPDDPVKLSKILKARRMIEKWLEACHERAHDLINNGGRVEGFKVVAKEGNRQWTVDDPAALSKALAKSGIMVKPGDLMSEPELISPAQLEKIVGKKKETAAAIAKLVMRPDNGTTIAPESDRRPSINPVSDFEDILGE